MGATFNPFTGTLDFTGTGGGGGGTPAAPDTSVQFNDGGSFGGDANLTWDKTANELIVAGADPTVSITGTGAFDNFGSSLYVEALSTDTTNSVAPRAAEFFSHATNATGSTLDIFGILIEAFQQGNGGADDILGVNIKSRNSGSGATLTIRGIENNILVAGNATTLIGYVDIFNINGGTTTNRYGLHLTNPSGGGALTNNYAILIDDQTKGGTLNYAIKTGAGLIAFGDEVDMATGKGIKLSTTDPHVAGVLWNNSGLAMISSG